MNLEGNQEVEDTRGLRDTVEARLKHPFAIFVIFFFSVMALSTVAFSRPFCVSKLMNVLSR